LNETTALLARPHGHALTADVIYLRPTDRSVLLQAAVELGILVREAVQAGHGKVHGNATPADILVAFTDGEAELRDVRLAAGHRLPVVVAVVPEGSRLQDAIEAGAEFCVHQSDGAALKAILRQAGHIARARRETEAPIAANAASVFGVLELCTAPPELRHGGHRVPLSPVEYQVLSMLVEGLGEPIGHEMLASQLVNGSTVTGYLKTVILRIRRKAAAVGGDASMLSAVRGSGYILRG